jgi:hypothetical protein
MNSKIIFRIDKTVDHTVENKYVIIDGNLLVGLTIDEATAKYPGIWIRGCKIDGESQVLRSDYRHDRHNVEIENDIITKYVNNG